MRTIITERRLNRHSIYNLVTLGDDEKEVAREVFDTHVSVEIIDDEQKVMVFDHKGTLIPEVYEYLNTSKHGSSLASRRQSAVALNLYYIFCEMNGIRPSELTCSKADELILFLRGQSVYGDRDGEKPYMRKPETVNAYYGTIKHFISIHEDWRHDVLNHVYKVHAETTIGDVTYGRDLVRDPRMLRTDPKERFMQPQYVSWQQVRELLSMMNKKGDVRAMLLVRLQFLHGLRSGEALGITLEDIKIEEGDATHDTRYAVVLRNRVSDKPWQSAKLLYHPKRTSEYATSTYLTARTWTIYISRELHDDMLAYYAATRNLKTVSRERLERIEKETIADSVEAPPMGRPADPNHYLFIGDNGRLYSNQTWNNCLKRYFLAAGMPIDEGVKTTGCSHRLRHGFAMFFAQDCAHPVTQLQLRDLMRHRSASSCLAYYTPSEEEELRLKEGLQKDLKSVLPELFEPLNIKTA